jgi:hypothetical protein
MAQTAPFVKSVKSFIIKRKVVTIPELIGFFNRSRATIFRTLAKIEHITSYNHNHSGITLPSTPTFDSEGLWKYNSFYFSKWRTLNETIQNIVNKSPTGFYPRELTDILGVRVHNHLSRCLIENKVVRNNDFGHPIYFSMIPETRQRQYEERIKTSKIRMPYEKPPLNKENTLRVLIAIIKYKVTTVEKLMPVLETEGIDLSEQSIKWVLKKYEIEKKGAP